MLVPLHVKSHYSLSEGTTPIAKLVERAAMLGLPALGLTDVENLYGQVVFHRLGREKGIRPVTGVELPVTACPGPIPPASRRAGPHGRETSGKAPGPMDARDARPKGRIVLIARNRAGYENLCRIITRRKLGASLEELAREPSAPARSPGGEDRSAHRQARTEELRDNRSPSRAVASPHAQEDDPLRSGKPSQAVASRQARADDPPGNRPPSRAAESHPAQPDDPLRSGKPSRSVAPFREHAEDSAPDRVSPPPPAGEEDFLDLLRGHLDGLFVLSDDPAIIERALTLPDLERKFARILLVRPGKSASREVAALEASRRLDVPIVADPDVSFLDPEDRPLHLLRLAMGRNLLISQVEELGLADREGRHFPGPRECEKLFADLPRAVEETHRIAADCNLDLRKAKPIWPTIPLPPGETAYSHLAKTAFRGIEKRFSRITPGHMERLAKELKIIEQLGFCEYFIVVGDIVRFARERGIEVVGRGSGTGSLVAHALGVTNVDPLEYGLYFERFLHPGRSDLPDIDIDLCWIRRDEVIDHVYRTYGADRVAMISSHVTLQPHLAFREAIKAFGIPMEEVNRYSRRIPYTHPEVSSSAPLRDLIALSPRAHDIPLDEEPLRTAVPLAERLIDHPHHLSIHPGGIVIGDRSIDAYVPLERATKGIIVTQYDMYSIEDVGLVKIDLLGNRCLTELQETIEIASEGGERLRLGDIPDADPMTVEVLQSARTLGCFQLESPAMRALLAKMKPGNIRDCIAAVAIIRPGAAAGGAKEAYIRRRAGEELPEYLHPSLRKILEEDHGIVIYEEDVMCIASAIAGISLAEGDKLRSALKKCRHPDDAKDLENDFVRKAVQNGVEPSVAGAVWQELRKFASYCFSKAHAAGYGVLAYQAAYLKAHFPVEFGCAVLNNHAGMYTTRTIAEEVKRMGARILHPSVHRSERRFGVERSPEDAPEGKAIRTGLARIKGLSEGSIEAILSARRDGPFQSLSDFLTRASIPRREVEALILSGTFGDLPPPPGMDRPLNQPQLLWELATCAQEGGNSSRSRPGDGDGYAGSSREGRRGAARAGASGASGCLLELGGGRTDYPPLKPYDPMVQMQNELKYLEIIIGDHPLRLLREAARRLGCISTKEAAAQAGRRVKVAGILAATRKVRTVQGRTMQFITLEDEEGLLEGTLFPKDYRAYSARILTLGPYIIEGKVEADHGAINLNISRVEKWADQGFRPVE